MPQPENPTWREIFDAAGDYLRHDLDVSKSLWADAWLAMGRELAAIALAIVSTKELGQEPGQIHSSYGGYFHGVLAKHKSGELHLERTVWDLRRKIDPERYASRERTRRRDAYAASRPGSIGGGRIGAGSDGP